MKRPGKMSFLTELLSGGEPKTRSEVVKLFMLKFRDVPEKTARNSVSWMCSVGLARKGLKPTWLPDEKKAAVDSEKIQEAVQEAFTLPKRNPLVSQHLENISREALEQLQEIIREYVRNQQGVYVLYRGDKIYYIGLASNLRNRLAQHMKDHHQDSWDRFSVYITIGDRHIREMESLIVRISKPPGNKQKGRFAKSEDLLRRFKRDLAEKRRLEDGDMFGEPHLVRKSSRSEVRPPTPSPRRSIAGLVEFIYELKQKGKTLEQVIEAGQNGKYAGLSACWFRDRWSNTPRSAKKDNPVNSKLSTTGRTAFIRKLRDKGNNWTTVWEKVLAKYPGSSISNCKKVWEKKERTPKNLTAQGEILFCPMKGAEARGHRIPDGDGFVVLKGSTAVLEERASSEKWPKWMAIRRQLIADGTLVEKDDLYEFTSSFVFSSPSAAATVIHGGPANGLTAWRTNDGKTLKELDKQA